MLSISATLENDKVVIEGLQDLAEDVPHAIRIALAKGAKETHRESFEFLSGAGGGAGWYPVPVQTGHLRRLLDWLAPQKTPGWTAQAKAKSVNGLDYATGDMEAMVYNSAAYSRSIHDGTGSSEKFGARPFITDGFERFNQGNKLAEITNQEIEKAARKRGFK